MAQQAPLRNNFSWTLLLTVVFFNCRQNSNVAPAVFLNANDPQTKLSAGVLYQNHIPFSGWQFALYQNGDTASITPFINGKEEGIATSWYENKKIKEIRIYHVGKKTGVHKGWWPDGSDRFIYSYENDIYEGVVKEWYASGRLFKCFHYKNGQEEGMQQQYFSDGLVQFNYEVRNGRQYGLTGVKNCVNVRDSVPGRN